jgi:hypothetical protein
MENFFKAVRLVSDSTFNTPTKIDKTGDLDSENNHTDASEKDKLVNIAIYGGLSGRQMWELISKT